MIKNCIIIFFAIFAAVSGVLDFLPEVRMKRESGERPEQTPLLYVPYFCFGIQEPLPRAGRRRNGDEPEDLPESVFLKLSGNKSFRN